MNTLERAAILLLGIGEKQAAEVLKHLSHKQVQKVGSAMTALSAVSQEELQAVIVDFINIAEKQTSLGVGADEYVKRMLMQALGEDKASGLISRITQAGSPKGLDALKWMDAQDVADMIRYEHPQIKSIVLSYIDSDQAAAVLKEFNDEDQIDLMLRVSSLESVQPHALEELNSIVEKHFGGKKTSKASALGGVKHVADIMNFLDGPAEQRIMSGIKESSPELGENIQDLMFIFDDIIEVDGRSIQTLLREVPSETLLLALKGADEPIREKFFTNMSKRAAELMRDDLEAKGPVRVSEVEAAQKEILSIARRMAESGEIVLGSKGDELI